MGATKRVAEMVCQSLDRERVHPTSAAEGSQAANTRYVTVRFGNVLGSTGSVIRSSSANSRAADLDGDPSRDHPLFHDRARGGGACAPSIDKDDALADGGGICVLDMGDPVKIVDLARQMIRLAGLTPDHDVRIMFTGLRPGEKLYEELFHDAENPAETAAPSIGLRAPNSGCRRAEARPGRAGGRGSPGPLGWDRAAAAAGAEMTTPGLTNPAPTATRPPPPAEHRGFGSENLVDLVDRTGRCPIARGNTDAFVQPAVFLRRGLEQWSRSEIVLRRVHMFACRRPRHDLRRPCRRPQTSAPSSVSSTRRTSSWVTPSLRTRIQSPPPPRAVP